MKWKNKNCRLFTNIILAILIIAFAATSNLQPASVLEDIGISSSLTMTTTTNQKSYLLRQKVEVKGNLTLDGSPASNLVVIVQINNPTGLPMVCRTLQIGNPTQTWPINITNLFITDTSNNPINTVKTNAQSQVRVGITLDNWQSTDRAIYATYTLFDANMVPFATKTWSGTINAQQSFTVKYPVDIPSWACSGKALLVGNVYTDEPEAGGLALSLEKTTYFCISRTQQGLLEYPTLPPPPPQTTPGIYSTYITLSPDPQPGQYRTYVLGQASPTTISSASTTFNFQNSAGYPPQASFVYWPATPYINMTVDFDASSSTPEGFNDTITKYEWDFGDGTPKISETDPTISHAYQQTETFIVALNITDNEGLWSTTSKPITIHPEFDPTANFTWTPETPILNETVTFDASNSKPGWSKSAGEFSPIVSYAWNFSDGTGQITETTPTIYHNFTQPGNYTVALTVLDDVGRTNSVSALIQVLNVTLKAYDFDGNGKIDMKDIRRVAKAFGSYPGDPNWDPVVDVNGDGKIDMKDIRPVAKNFGQDP
jgi:PKD repeat protein